VAHKVLLATEHSLRQHLGYSLQSDISQLGL